MENCFAQYRYGGHSGKEFSYESYDSWQQNIQSIMYAGELKVAARPLIMDGGIDNKKFAMLPKERRHELFMYGYASYLMAVKVEADNRIFTQFGLCPFVYTEGSSPYVEVDSCFTWDIGKPAETYASVDYLKYQIKDLKAFARRFENGIVLVNPSDEDIKNIPLKTWGGALKDPGTHSEIRKTIDLPAHSGRILLYPSKQKK